MEMTQTWIIFTVNNQRVHQMSYNGCTGKDQIEDEKSFVAGRHKVAEAEVSVSFDEEETTSQNQTITSSELVSSLKIEMTRNTFNN